VLLDSLNEQQVAAVSADAGPVLVLAGPGSGKTRVLTYRIAWLIKEMRVDPMSMMSVTFTNKAAEEMRQRLERILGGRPYGMRVGTFHSICARILRREAAQTQYSDNFTIFDTDDQLTAINQALNELNLDPKQNRPRSVLEKISSAKSELLLPNEFPTSDYPSEVARRVYERYQAILLSSDGMDFDDLLMQTALLLRNNDAVREKYQRAVEWVLVDEFQDTNTAQYQLVRMFGRPHDNVFVVGDEDQGIYAFRGADWRNVNQFRKDYPAAKVVLLERNYRSTQNVLDAARNVIDRNTQRTPKALFTDQGAGEPVELDEAYNEEFEARKIVEKIDDLIRASRRASTGISRLNGDPYTYGDMAVMYRTNTLSRPIEEAMRREAIPYKLVGAVGFYKRREIKDLTAYLRLVNTFNDSISFKRVVNTPKRGIGDKSVADFMAWANKNKLQLGAALERVSGDASIIPGRVGKLFSELGAQLMRWKNTALNGTLLALLDQIIGDTGYRFYISEFDEPEELAQERIDNIDEMRRLLKKADESGQSLAEYLTELTLVADVDDADPNADAVTLLTLHAAKGLEYPVVFIVGCEEGLLPHARSLDTIDGVAEERRLFYVGITRAEERLYLSFTARRNTFNAGFSEPSRFLKDIPASVLRMNSSSVISKSNTWNMEKATRWDNPGQSRQSDAPRDGRFTQNARSKIVPFPGSGAPRTVPAAGPRYPMGKRVFHSRFGNGMVIESRGRGDSETTTVVFEDKAIGIKTFLASDGILKLIEG
jgi:DNA helicase-2/ATP-dependent DNA helicase PcrA